MKSRATIYMAANTTGGNISCLHFAELFIEGPHTTVKPSFPAERRALCLNSTSLHGSHFAPVATFHSPALCALSQLS